MQRAKGWQRWDTRLKWFATSRTTFKGYWSVTAIMLRPNLGLPMDGRSPIKWILLLPLLFANTALGPSSSARVTAQEEFGRPTWAMEDKWRYHSAEVAGRNTAITDYDIRVVRVATYGGEPVYVVEHLGSLRAHPVVAFTRRPGQPSGPPSRIWTLYTQDLAPRAWLDTNCAITSAPASCPWLEESGDWSRFTILATLEGWRAFDWPLAVGKRWSGRASVKGNTEGIDEYRAEVAGVEDVSVRGGMFRAALVVHRGSIREGNRRVDYTMRTWFAPAVRNIVKVELAVGQNTLSVELSR